VVPVLVPAFPADPPKGRDGDCELEGAGQFVRGRQWTRQLRRRQSHVRQWDSWMNSLGGLPGLAMPLSLWLIVARGWARAFGIGGLSQVVLRTCLCGALHVRGVAVRPPSAHAGERWGQKKQMEPADTGDFENGGRLAFCWDSRRCPS
jgi:hypothetical protein